MQVENKQPEVLTEQHFAEAEKRQLNQKLSKDELHTANQAEPYWSTCLAARFAS